MPSGRSPERRGVGTCERCEKVSYASRGDAKAAKRAIHPGEKMHAYPCPRGPYWHVGHDDLWRDLAPDDLIWKPMPRTALAQVRGMALAMNGAPA